VAGFHLASGKDFQIATTEYNKLANQVGDYIVISTKFREPEWKKVIRFGAARVKFKSLEF
jgi:hypothetical protein